jgi:hypothetical protein
MNKQQWMQALVAIVVIVGLAAGAMANSPCDETRVAGYYFEGDGQDSDGTFADALLGSGDEIDADYLNIDDNLQDYACLDSDILNGVSDYTMTIRFRLDTIKDVNTLFYILDLGVGGGTQLAVRMEDGVMKWNMYGIWTSTGVTLSANTWYELEVMRFANIFKMYLNDQRIVYEIGVSTDMLQVTGGTFGGESLTGILLGQDICTTCQPPFGSGASLSGDIDYVVFYHCGPVATEETTFSGIKAMYRQ